MCHVKQRSRVVRRLADYSAPPAPAYAQMSLSSPVHAGLMKLPPFYSGADSRRLSHLQVVGFPGEFQAHTPVGGDGLHLTERLVRAAGD